MTKHKAVPHLYKEKFNLLVQTDKRRIWKGKVETHGEKNTH